MPLPAQISVQVGAAPQPPVELVSHEQTWRYRKGTSEPPGDWHSIPDGSLDASWLAGPGGFGFGDGDDATVLNDMRGNYLSVYTRLTFNVAAPVNPNDRLQLRMDWDDGFVAYLDGVEVARSSNVPGTPGQPHPHDAGVAPDHPAAVDGGAVSVFDLGVVGSRLDPGPHILAVQGINGDLSSSDVTLIADLLLADAGGGTLLDGPLFALVDNAEVNLSGASLFGGTVRVMVDGLPAAFSPADGAWTRSHSLRPGFNRVFVAALDAVGNLLGSITRDVIVQTDVANAGGALLTDTTWAPGDGIVRLITDVTVEAGVTLTVNPGVVVLIPPGGSITALAGGAIVVQGTEDQPVRFLPSDAASHFGFLAADGAGASLTVVHGDIASGHLKANDGGRLLVEDSELRETFSGLLVSADFGEEVVLRRCHIHDYNQIHIDFTPATIEDCLIENVYSDATDFAGADFDVVVQRNTYRRGFGSNTDAFDADDSVGIVVRDCLIRGFPDKGVSIADLSDFTVVSNNLIYDCGSGVSAYAASNLLFLNNTIFNCQFGLYLWDRENHPGPAQGTATNNILWGNTNSLLVIDGSILGLSYSDVDGPVAPPGEGNINTDPLFVDPEAGDFNLQPGSPARGAGSDGADMGVQFPVGGIPAAPFNLAVVHRESGVRLAWEQDAENETGFLVARSGDGLAWDTVGEVGANQTQYDDVGGSELYAYRMRATNSSGLSAFSNVARAPNSETIVGGVLTQNTTWSPGLGTILVRSNVTVPAGVTLTIQPGTLVRLTNNVWIRGVGGTINIVGAPGHRVVLEPWVVGQQWNEVQVSGAGSSLTIQHAEISGGQIEMGTGSIGLIEDSYIHDFYQGATPIVQALRAASCTLRRCHVAFYHETLFQITPTLIEDCLFENATNPSSDALDFDGAPPGSTIRRSTFRNGVQENTDAIDIGPTAGVSSIGVIIEDCVMYNFSDKGVSIGEGSFDITVRNCLIYDVTRGIQVKDISTATVYGCTIVDSDIGLHGFEKTAGTGGGLFTNTYNNILSGLLDPIVVESDTVMVVNYTDTQGINWPGIGNIDVDPLFLDPAARDYRLAQNSACRGAGLNGADLGVTYPIGGVPLLPADLAVMALTDNQAVLAWSDQSDNETSFVVEHSTDGSSWTWAATLPADSSQGAVSGDFSVAQPHYFRVRAANFIGQSLNSNVASSAADPNDIDGDGLPNDWESDNGLNPADPNDADLDSDSDGLSNREEFLAGTDPQDPSSRLAVERVQWVGSEQVELEFVARAGKVYRVEYRDSLSSDTWHELWEIPAEDFTRPYVFTDFLPPGKKLRFYRIRVE